MIQTYEIEIRRVSVGSEQDRENEEEKESNGDGGNEKPEGEHRISRAS